VTVKRLVPAVLLPRPVSPPALSGRPQYPPHGGAVRPPAGKETVPYLSVRATLAFAAPRPQLLRLPVPPRAVFIFGPRLTIIDPGNVFALNGDQGLSLTIADPGNQWTLPGS
jgi:hypothetical protein